MFFSVSARVLAASTVAAVSLTGVGLALAPLATARPASGGLVDSGSLGSAGPETSGSLAATPAGSLAATPAGSTGAAVPGSLGAVLQPAVQEASVQRVVVTVGAIGGEVRDLHLVVDEADGYAHTSTVARVRVEHAGISTSTTAAVTFAPRSLELTTPDPVPADSTVTVELPVEVSGPVGGMASGTVDAVTDGNSGTGPSSTSLGARIVDGAARLG